MARLTWTRPAIRDLQGIEAWIERSSPYYAANVVRQVRASVQQLRRFPESGRTVPERSARGYRELIVGTYRVVYRYDHDRDTVVIVTVLHGRQQFRLPPTGP
jgi:toxin ParE1/3/4